MKKEESFIKKMWQNPRGKAILKLGLWFIFFLVVGMFFLITSPNPQNKSQNETQTETHYEPLSDMLEQLKTEDLSYEYQIIKDMDTITLKGDREDNIEIGYKESKLGIIKYKKTEEKVYQIIMDTEEEIPSLLEEEDENYLNISWIEERTKTMTYQESVEETKRKISYHGEESIIITTTPNQILKMEIKTPTTNYILNYEIK